MINNDPKISVISPIYRAEKIIDELIKQIIETLQEITDNFEIILVNDGSPDNSWQKILDNIKKYPQVTGINLSRNFGQHPAIFAGLRHSKGEWIVVMDCDLQDPPHETKKLYDYAIQNNLDYVLAKRENRKDSFFKKFCSQLYCKLISYLTGTYYSSETANFGIYHRKVINTIIDLKESHLIFPFAVQWVGYKHDTIGIEHAARYEGKSSYSFSRLISLAINSIISFSDKPLRLILKLGLVISFISFIAAIITLIRYWLGTITQPGYTSLILSFWFLSGIIISVLGITGLYVGRAFNEVKGRPNYIISEIANKRNTDN